VAGTSVILDAHVHFWDPGTRHHAWLDEHSTLRRRFVPADYDAGRHAVGGAVFVQADCRDDEALDEVRWVTALAEGDPFVRGIVAYAPLHLGSAAEDALAAVAAEPLVVGVRRLLQGQPLAALEDRALIDGVGLLARHDLPFDLCVARDQLPAVTRLVDACPDVRFVLDHLGKPSVAAAQLDPWRGDLARLAALPNVACKLSGLTTEAAPGWQAADVRPYLDHALDAFSPARCMVGSDWPVASLATTTERWFDVVLDALAFLDGPARSAVLSATAKDFYRLGAVAPRPGSAHASSDVHR
jgi:L-fuconolactonase